MNLQALCSQYDVGLRIDTTSQTVYTSLRVVIQKTDAIAFKLFKLGTPLTATSGQVISLVIGNGEITFEKAFDPRYQPLLDKLKEDIQEHRSQDLQFFLNRYHSIYLC